MKLAKRITAILLALAMLLTLASCGGTASTTDNSTSENNQSGTDENFVGRGANNDPNMRVPNFKLKSNVTTELVTADEPQFELFNTLFNASVKFIVVSPGEYENKLISLVMSDNSPDMFTATFKPMYIKKNIAQPVDNYLDFNLGIWKGIKKSLDLYKWQGHYYMATPVFGRWDVIWFNKEIFEEAGLETPDKLLEKNEWTWNKLREIAKALTIDADNNGDPEQWGLCLDDCTVFIHSTGKDFVTLNEDGTATNNIKSAEIARAMQFYTDLYNKDKCAYKADDGRDQFAAGKIAMISGGLWYRSPFKDMMAKESILFVPYPRDEQADKYYCREGADGFFICYGAKNPEGAAAYVSSKRFVYIDDEWLMKDYDMVRADCNWSMDDHHMLWDWVQGTKLTPVPYVDGVFNVFNYWGDIFFRTREGEAWATIAEEISPKVDQEISAALES